MAWPLNLQTYCIRLVFANTLSRLLVKEKQPLVHCMFNISTHIIHSFYLEHYVLPYVDKLLGVWFQKLAKRNNQLQKRTVEFDY